MCCGAEFKDLRRCLVMEFVRRVNRTAAAEKSLFSAHRLYSLVQTDVSEKQELYMFVFMIQRLLVRKIATPFAFCEERAGDFAEIFTSDSNQEHLTM